LPFNLSFGPAYISKKLSSKKAKSYSALAKQLLEYVANIIIICKACLLKT